MAMLPIQYPQNALIDFSPVNSALNNYRQQIGVNNRLAMMEEQERRQAELHPLSVRQHTLQADTAEEALRQGRQMHPIQLSTAQLALQQAQEAARRQRLFNEENDRLFGGVAVPPTALRGVASLPQTGSPTPSAPQAAAAPAPSTTMPGITVAPSSQPRQAQQAPDLDAEGARLIQQWVLDAPVQVGEGRFEQLRNDPVFGPAIESLGNMDWRMAAQTMAGMAVTPTTQPAAAAAPAATPPAAVRPAPQAASAPTQQPMDAQAARQYAVAINMLRNGTPEQQNQARQTLENLRKLNFNTVGGRLVATDTQGNSRVVYDPGATPDASAATNISGGIGELAAIPDRYGGDTGVFTSAVGSLQGDQSISNILGPLARAWGSASSYFTPTNSANRNAPPAEVRRAIEGATNTLAAALKPLIRKPGEGTWSDRDQDLLNSIVGELTKVNDRAQYMRELGNVRNRINANFGLELPPIPGASPAPQAGAPQRPPAPNPFIPQATQQQQPSPVQNFSPQPPQSMTQPRPQMQMPPSPSQPGGGNVQQQPNRGQQTPNPQQALQQARDAIARGAPRAAVAERLRSMGVDPSGL